MSLATLANIPAESDPRSFAEFSFSNMDRHRDVIFAIGSQRQINLPLYVLDPIPLYDISSWLYTHQAAHNDINDVLSVEGVDLTAIDFRDQEQVASWIRLHVNEHQQWDQILGLS